MNLISKNLWILGAIGNECSQVTLKAGSLNICVRSLSLDTCLVDEHLRIVPISPPSRQNKFISHRHMLFIYLLKVIASAFFLHWP